MINHYCIKKCLPMLLVGFVLVTSLMPATPALPQVVVRTEPVDKGIMKIYGYPNGKQLSFTSSVPERCYELVESSNDDLGKIAKFYEAKLESEDVMRSLLKAHPITASHNNGRYHFSYYKDIASGFLAYTTVWDGEVFSVTVHRNGNSALIYVFVKQRDITKSVY